MLQISGFCWPVSCLPCAGMKAEEFSPSVGHRGLISGSDTFQNNRENGSLLVYFCLIPALGPILLKVGGELDHILESLRAFEMNLFVIRGKCE